LEPSVCSSVIGSVSRNNNQDATVVVFIMEKTGLENSLSQMEGGGMGRRNVQVEKQAVEGKDPKWRPAVGEGEPVLCRSEERSHRLVEIKLLCFRQLSPVFKCVHKGSPGFA
jgi:hypothetical protein